MGTEKIDTDKQVRDESNDRKDVVPGDIADNEDRDINTCHQDGLKSPGIELSFYPLHQGQYQITDGDANDQEGNIVAIIHFSDRFLNVGSDDTPREDPEKDIYELGNHSRLVGSPS